MSEDMSTYICHIYIYTVYIHMSDKTWNLCQIECRKKTGKLSEKMQDKFSDWMSEICQNINQEICQLK